MCKCDRSKFPCADGCDECNPALALEFAREMIAEYRPLAEAAISRGWTVVDGVAMMPCECTCQVSTQGDHHAGCECHGTGQVPALKTEGPK